MVGEARERARLAVGRDDDALDERRLERLEHREQVRARVVGDDNEEVAGRSRRDDARDEDLVGAREAEHLEREHAGDVLQFVAERLAVRAASQAGAKSSSREVVRHPSRKLRDRLAPSFVVLRRVEEGEERAHAPHRFEPRRERAAFTPVPVVKATREGAASARTIGVDRTPAAVPQRRERRTRLLERASALEDAEALLSCAGDLVGVEADAPEEGSVATESARST